jgi:cysteinyl-tRNA synthetase
MIAGARVEVAPYKRDPMDFVLWKPSPPELPGWESPWGRGRPGWHIECSAMSWKMLGESFDIHGGGIDLVFPHHENEIAQSRCAFDTPLMARYWMHNGFLQVEGRKMSKSEGNFVTIRDLLDDWPGEALRFNMLRTHYRQPLDWTLRGLEESLDTLEKLYDRAGRSEAGAAPNAVLDALSDDLNTPLVISELHQLKDPNALAGSLSLLGFSGDPERIALPHPARVVDETRIATLIEARDAARAARNWTESDRIRDLLAAEGVELKDSREGTSWKVRR